MVARLGVVVPIARRVAPLVLVAHRVNVDLQDVVVLCVVAPRVGVFVVAAVVDVDAPLVGVRVGAVAPLVVVVGIVVVVVVVARRVAVAVVVALVGCAVVVARRVAVVVVLAVLVGGVVVVVLVVVLVGVVVVLVARWWCVVVGLVAAALAGCLWQLQRWGLWQNH